MRKILIIKFLFISGFSFGQVTDNFSDGDFINNPAWGGDGAQFTVNSSSELQLNSTGTDTSYLAVPNTASLNNCEWNFWIKLGFSPSSNNNARVYLVADQQNLKGLLNGYYLQFGEANSNDQVELFRQSGSISTSVCRGTTLIASSFSIRIRVTRDASGTWQLNVDPGGGSSFQLEATGTDTAFTTTAYFGMVCKYTSSYATKMYFDDVYVGPIAQDTTSPAQPNDIIINEILYDPLTGGKDFVELYNRSSRTINLKSLNISSGDYDTQVLDDIQVITGENIYLLPGNYAVLTESPQAVMSQYYCPSQSTFVQVASLPAYNVDNDMVALV